MSETQSNQRQYYRLVYPFSQMPVIIVNDDEFGVTEVSEKGLIFEFKKANKFRVGDWITGLIRFKDGQTAKIAGRTIRINRNHIVIGQLQGLTFRNLINEQRNIFKRFASH